MNECKEEVKVIGYVFVDKNENGIYDPKEKGLNGIEVLVKDTKGVVVNSAYTSDGGYWEANLCPARYVFTTDFIDTQKAKLKDQSLLKDIMVGEKYNDVNFKVIQLGGIDINIILSGLALILGVALTLFFRKLSLKKG